MDVLVSGASGLLGSRLHARLEARGDRVLRLVRGRGAGGDIPWEPFETLAERLPARLDAVIHLAGEPVFGVRWTAAKKRRIRESRVVPTRALADALATRIAAGEHPPRCLAASAIGFYDPALPGPADEDAPPAASDFLSSVCIGWEAPLASVSGLSCAVLRTGLVLAPEGGALPRLLPPWRLGLGGRLGPSRVPWNWIHAADWCEAALFLLDRPELAGPFNLVSPGATDQGEAARTLARVLGRPNWLHQPAWLLRALLGEMADGLLLRGPAVRPARLQAAGYRFRFPELETALVDLLAR